MKASIPITAVDPLDVSQWRFYVLPTSTLDEALGDQKTLSLTALLSLNPQEVAFGEIGDAIDTTSLGAR